MKTSPIPKDQLPPTKPAMQPESQAKIEALSNDGDGYWDRFFDQKSKSYVRYGTHEIILSDGIYYHRSISRYSLFMAATLEDAKRAIDILEQ